MLNPSSSSKIMFSSGEDSPEKNSGRYSNHEDSEDQDDLNSLLYYSSDSLREYIQKGYDAENSSSGFSDEDGENTTILSITNSDTNDSMDNGKGDYEYDEDIGRSGCDGSDECDDKISSSLMNDDSVDSVGKSSSSSSRLILSGSDKFEARSKSNRRRETGRKQSKRTSSGSSHFFGEIKKSSAVKFQQSAMANPLMKRFLHDNCTFQLGDCDCKPSLGSTQGDDGIQDEFATPAGAAAKRRFDGNDDRKVGHAATTDHGNMSHPAKRTKNRNKQYIQMQQELCREKQHNAGSDSRQDSARNSAFSVASAWSSSITTTVTSAASSSAASLSDTKHTKSTQKNQSLELKYSESGYGSSFCDKRCDLKIAFSAAPFSTSPGTIRKAGATNDTVKSGRRKRGKASMGNKTSQGARTKQQPGSSMCSGTSHNDKDDPGYPYFNYVDHSLEDDDEPLVFLVPPSRVATFPVKMHVILSRKDLSHVISWMPHGRSWRLVDPVEFELTVIPTYFGHASLSSFMRQANGWGFKRVTKGRDMNSYYHEHFLRGLPHLCKKIPQPGSIKSKPEKTDVFREPDFAEISKNRPLPVEIDPKDVYAASLETIGKCILKDGPKARMPIICIDAGTASKRNEIASSLPVSSSIVKTDHSNEVHDSSASQQPSKVNNEATLTSPSGSNALMTSNAVSSVAAPQSTLINGFEAIKPLLQLQQHQPPQPQPVYRQLDNQQPPPVQLSNMTNNQTILQLQIMLMLHFNPSMLAGSTVLNSSGFQALNNQNTSAQNNTLHGNNSGQQSSHEAIDPNVLTLARQIVQMNATGGQTLHHQRSMESNSLADFYASTGNLAMSQAPQNNNTLSNQNLSGNPPNYEALATQIFGTLVHQYGQKQVQQHQHQHHQHHQQPQPQPQQQMQQQQQQQLSQFNQLLMRAATAGAMIQSDPLLTSGSRNHSTNNASQSSNDDVTRRHNSKNDPDG